MPDVINSEWGERIKLQDLHLEGPFEGGGDDYKADYACCAFRACRYVD